MFLWVFVEELDVRIEGSFVLVFNGLEVCCINVGIGINYVFYGYVSGK